jgi:hypothetical protein
MKRFKILIDGVTRGHIEALDGFAAMELVMRSYAEARDPKHATQLERDERAMHILIDSTNNRVIARHDSQRALAALSVIQFANVEAAIIRLGENRAWSVFNEAALRSIAASLGLIVDAHIPYATIIESVRKAAESTAWLELPMTTEELEGQVYRLARTDDKPAAINPGGHEAKRLDRWTFDPQRNTRRDDATYWHMFASGRPAAQAAQAGAPPPPAAPAPPKAPAPPSAPKPPTKGGKAPPPPAAPGAAPKPPKASTRAPAQAGERPKAGSTTGKVWDVCDAAYAAAKGQVDDWKAFRKAVVQLGEKEGINGGTVGVQFGKWKAATIK